MYLSITIVRAIVDELLRQGVSLAEFCARAGLDPAELSDADLRLPIERATRVVAAATEISASGAIGLHVGELAPTKTLHVVGHLLSSCATMREAVRLFLRYSALVFEGAGFHLFDGTERARFVYEHPFPGSPFERFSAELSLTVVLKIGLQLASADIRPVEVCFRHAAPDYLDEYERIFRCPVRFSHAHNQLVFDRRLLDIPQLYSDDPLCELLRERAEHLLAHANAAERLPERIVEAVKLELETGNADPERLARRIGMTVRSLNRRLQPQSLSLKRLIDDARRQLSCTMLATAEVPIKDVAHRTGFSEPSAFYRAFRRWTGMTPAEYRSQAMARRAGA